MKSSRCDGIRYNCDAFVGDPYFNVDSILNSKQQQRPKKVNRMQSNFDTFLSNAKILAARQEKHAPDFSRGIVLLRGREYRL